MAMSPEDFVAAVKGGLMPSAIQAVYIDSSAPASLDAGKFRTVNADGGVYVQTTPALNTFALHHLGALALALSGSSPEERKTAPHDSRRRKYFQRVAGRR